MYLVSCNNHIPIAVFDSELHALNYIQKRNNISSKYVCSNDMTDTYSEVYIEKYHDEPRKTLGFIRAGVQINPKV